MIINGGARTGAKSLAAHLLNTTKNERVAVLEVRGCLATDLRGALVEMEESAEATRCQKPLYHANIDPDRNVKMTIDQWQRSVEVLEDKLGLQDHPRAVVMHVKNGRRHIHVVWNRIDLETMKTARDSHNYRKHELVARELEREFGHDRVQGAHIERDGQPRPDRTPPKWAMQQGERLKVDPRQVETQVRDLWAASDSGRSFAAGLTESGYTLAKGDRRDFMVIDPAGGAHSLGRLTEVKTAALRARMADINRDALPTVDQAVAAHRKRAAAEPTAKRQAVGKEFKAAAAITKQTARDPAPTSLPRGKELDETMIDLGIAYRVNNSAGAFAKYLSNRGIQLAVVTDKEATQDKTHRAGEIVAVNSMGQVYALDRRTMGDDRAKVEKFLETFDRSKLQSVEDTQEQINLGAEQFIAGTQIGLLKRSELEGTSLPSRDPEQDKQPQPPDRQRDDRDR